MAQFIRHESCPKCGSRNNVGVWDDGHKFCYSPECDYQVKGNGTLSAAVGSGKKFFRLPPLTSINEFIRGVSPTTLQKFWVGLDLNSGGADGAMCFTYFDTQNKVTGAKYRDISRWNEKYFWQKGECTLFGIHCADKRAGVILFEGEFDALAGYEMYGFKYSCLSVAHGASGAKKDLVKYVEWLESTFDEILICFDNDEAGDKAAEEAMVLFRTGKARRVRLPATVKDSNEMLMADDREGFRSAVDAAKAPVPHGFVDPDELLEQAMRRREDPDWFKGESFGFDAMDYYTGGLQEDEIIIIAGETGIGKTALVRQMAYNILLRDVKVCWISLEMPPLRVLEQFVETHLHAPYHIQGCLQHTEQVYRAAEEFIMKEKGLLLYQNFGAMDSKSICDRMIHAHLAYGCKVFVIDHLAIMTSNKDWKEIDALMSAINSVVIEYHLCVLAVAQYSSTGNIRGSKGQDQIASCVLNLERDQRSTVMKVSTGKPHRYSPVGYGEFYLNFDKATRSYEAIRKKDAWSLQQQQIFESYEKEKGGETESTSFSAYVQRRLSKPTVTEESETEGTIRESGSTSKSSSPVDVRTDYTELDCDTQLQTRLQVHIKERQSYLCGIEGSLESSGSPEADSSERSEPAYRLEDFVSRCEQTFEQATNFPNVWGVGNKEPVSME